MKTDDTLRILAVADPAVIGILSDENLLKPFEHMHDTKLEIDILPWAQYYTELMRSFGETKYDIMMIAGHLWLNDFVSRGWLMPINDGFSSGYDYDDILKPIRDEIELDEKHYLFPFFCDGHMLIYRKTALKENLNRMVSVDEMLGVVHQRGSEQKSFVLKAHPSEIFQDVLPYLRSENIEPMSEKNQRCLNSESAVKAVSKYIEAKRYCLDGVETFQNEEVARAIKQADCELGVTWSGQIGAVMDDRCKEPTAIAFSAIKNALNVTWSFGIHHLSKRYEYAKQFLEYITSKEMDKRTGEICGNPVRRSRLISEADNNKWYPMVHQMIEHSKPIPNQANIGTKMGIIAMHIHSAFVEEVTVKAALRAAMQACERLNK